LKEKMIKEEKVKCSGRKVQSEKRDDDDKANRKSIADYKSTDVEVGAGY
jgi:hypothetical protein